MFKHLNKVYGPIGTAAVIATLTGCGNGTDTQSLLVNESLSVQTTEAPTKERDYSIQNRISIRDELLGVISNPVYADKLFTRIEETDGKLTRFFDGTRAPYFGTAYWRGIRGLAGWPRIGGVTTRKYLHKN